MADIPRKDMAKHEQVECQEIVIECEFKAVGCDHAKVKIQFVCTFKNFRFQKKECIQFSHIFD